METYSVTIEGISPLLMNAFPVYTEISEQTRKILQKTKTAREQAETAAYRLPNGNLFLPQAAIPKLLCDGATGHKTRGSRKSLKYVMVSAARLCEPFVSLTDARGKPLRDFEIDSRPVVIPATKGRIMKHRPKIEPWFGRFSLEIEDDDIEPAIVNTILAEGGRRIGVGDYRPQKTGQFGRFIVIEWSKVTTKPLRKTA